MSGTYKNRTDCSHLFMRILRRKQQRAPLDRWYTRAVTATVTAIEFRQALEGLSGLEARRKSTAAAPAEVRNPDNRSHHAGARNRRVGNSGRCSRSTSPFVLVGRYASHRPYEVNSYSDASGDIRTTNPATGITSYAVRNANGTVSTFTTRPGLAAAADVRQQDS